jgi:predicted esterase
MTDTPPEVPVLHRIEVPRSARYAVMGGSDRIESLWVVLHGFGMLAGDFIKWFAPAATPRRLIIAPEALSRYYTDHASRKVGATWMTSEDRLVEIDDYVRYLDLVLDDVRKRWSIPEVPVEVHGFSQGTATASRWVAMGRVHSQRLVLWAGGVPPDLDLSHHGPVLTAASLTLVLGDRDKFLDEAVIRDEMARLDAAGVTYSLRRFQGGHVVPWPVLQELAR